MSQYSDATQLAALHYAEKYDLSIVPYRDKQPLTNRGYKNATRDLAVIRSWWEKWPDADVAVACRPSGVLVLDADTRHGGDEAFHVLERRLGKLPDTPRSLTGGGGFHVFLKNPNVNTVGRLAKGVDVRDRACAVEPPSSHHSGRGYEWEIGLDEASLAEVPEGWLVALTRKPQRKRKQEGDLIFEGERNNTLFDFAKAMRSAGLAEDAILTALNVTNETRCRPPLDSSDVATIARSAGKLAIKPLWKVDVVTYASQFDLGKVTHNVLVHLAHRADYDGDVIGGEWVADESKQNVDVVRRALRELQTKGIIEKTGGGGYGKANRYRIVKSEK